TVGNGATAESALRTGYLPIELFTFLTSTSLSKPSSSSIKFSIDVVTSSGTSTPSSVEVTPRFSPVTRNSWYAERTSALLSNTTSSITSVIFLSPSSSKFNFLSASSAVLSSSSAGCSSAFFLANSASNSLIFASNSATVSSSSRSSTASSSSDFSSVGSAGCS